MLGQTSLPDMKTSLAKAAVSQDAASRKSIRFLWTSLGFATLMLVGVSCMQKVAHATARSHSFAELEQSHLNVQTPVSMSAAGHAAFVPGGALPIQHRGAGQNPAVSPAMLHVHSLAAPAGHRSFLPARVRSVDPGSRTSGLRMAASGEGGDGDFQTALSQLAPIEELPKLRDTYRELEQQMNIAVETEDFDSAIRYRNEMQELRAKDPAFLAKETRQAMWRAAKTDDFAGAAKQREHFRALREYLPEYKLGGRWLGRVRNWDEKYAIPEKGRFNIDLVYNGDKLIAFQSGLNKFGEVLFEADVGDVKDNPHNTIVHGGKIYATYFEGTGHIEGDAIPGKLYLMADGNLGFSFDAKAGDDGDGKQLAVAGGKYDPLAVVAGGDGTGATAANVEQGPEDEGLRNKLFVVFERS